MTTFNEKKPATVKTSHGLRGQTFAEVLWVCNASFRGRKSPETQKIWNGSRKNSVVEKEEQTILIHRIE